MPLLKARPPTVDELDRLIAAATGRLTDRATAEFVPLLRGAIDELQRDLGDWLDRAPDGGTRFTAFHLQQVLQQLRGSLARIAELRPDLQGSLEAGGDQAGALAARHVREQVAALSSQFEGSAYLVPIDEAALIATGRSLLIPRFRTSAARYVGNVRDDIRRQLALGVLRGETIDQLTDRLVRLGGPSGWVALRGIKGRPGAVVEKIGEGLFRRYRYWAERVVRTELMHAYNTQADIALEQAHAEDPAIKRRWNAAADWRLCPICAALDGAVVNVGEAFPGGYQTAPAHPNCRCNVGPWKEAWQSPAGTRGGGAASSQKLTVAKTGNAVEDKIREVEVNELSIRPRERLTHFSPTTGKRGFSVDGTTSSVSVTGAQVAQLAGQIVTHNHPRNVAYNTLSDADVNAWLRIGTHSVRAVAREPGGVWLYEMKAGAGPRPSWAQVAASHSKHYAALAPKARSYLEAYHHAWVRVAKDLGIVYRRTRIDVP